LETILLKAIDREPARRYQAADELADDLQRFLENRPIQARRVGLAERAWRWRRRNPVLAAVSALLAGAVLLTLATLTVAVVWINASLNDAERLAGEKDQLFHSEKALREQQELDNARLYFEQAYRSCSEDDPTAGLLRLCRSLEKAVAVGDTQLEESIRLHL